MENLLPPLPPDSLSAADVFGAASELVLRDGATHAVNAGAGDAVLQFAALTVTLLYIYTVVRYSDVVRAILFSAVGSVPSKRGRQRHFNFAVQRNVEIVVAVSGVIAAAVVAVRLLGAQTAAANLHTSVLTMAGTVVAGLVALAAFEYSAVRAVGFVSGRSDVCTQILQLKLRHLSAAVAVVLPVGILFLFATPNIARACFYVMAVQCSISAILFAKESFSLFISQRVSILYWILYLCTLEIFPVSLLLAPLMREGSGV